MVLPMRAFSQFLGIFTLAAVTWLGLSGQAFAKGAGSTSGTVSFLVADSTGEPIVDAFILVENQGKALSFQGGLDGITIDLKDLKLIESVVVGAPGYVKEMIAVAPGQKEFAVILQKGRAISGLVVDSTGAPVAGVRVCGWPVNVRADPLMIADSLRGYGQFPIALSGKDGKFVLQWVRKNAHLRIVAGGAGWVSRDSETLLSFDDQVDIQVSKLFGAALSYLDDASGERLDFGLIRPTATRFRCAGAESSRWPEANALALAGIPEKYLGGGGTESLSSEAVLATSDSTFNTQLPGHLRMGLPGYAQWSDELNLPRITDEITPLQIPLAKLATEVGTLVVEWGHVATSRSQTSEFRDKFFFIRLRPKFDAAIQIIEVRGFAQPLRLKNIPIGEYEVDVRTFKPLIEHVQLSSKLITISSSESASLEVHFTRTTSASLSILDSTGAPFHGEVSIEVLNAKTDRLIHLKHFFGSPYRFEHLPFGVLHFRAFFTPDGRVRLIAPASAGKEIVGTLIPRKWR
jgi:hypothetical protein